jgi:hypothetical protein
MCCHLGQGMLDGRLHRMQLMSLYLPAPEGAAIVFDTECDSHK